MSTHVSMEEFYQIWKNKKENEIVLDVRGRDEFDSGHIPGAINIPHTEVTDHIDQLKGYEHIYVHCKMGGRSQQAYADLREAGLENLTCVAPGGMSLWKEKNWPVE